jgi:hypothetical protein
LWYHRFPGRAIVPAKKVEYFKNRDDKLKFLNGIVSGHVSINAIKAKRSITDDEIELIIKFKHGGELTAKQTEAVNELEELCRLKLLDFENVPFERLYFIKYGYYPDTRYKQI